MSLHTRLSKLRRAVADRPPPGQLWVVTAVPAGCGMAEGRPPGVYVHPGGTGATVVFAGPEPDPAVMAPVKARLAPWGLLIVGHPDEVPRPELPFLDDPPE